MSTNVYVLKSEKWLRKVQVKEYLEKPQKDDKKGENLIYLRTRTTYKNPHFSSRPERLKPCSVVLLNPDLLYRHQRTKFVLDFGFKIWYNT